ncbi:TetR/AcrR family transcriptional regulator [Pusillimonas caeni]|uniref:TetR/AcrR family transcriptional regulator n=1 Tax=Pusillimonas caeni TaxID=1348472 RepID=UPI000E59F4EB|nr:TetR/AcrR family transcriptional regulator [Pusillimonas caeni]TFL15411.1 TetR/AcrR family transcriptional regulator [Pusillimonas caeni]
MSKTSASPSSISEPGNGRAQLTPNDWVDAALEVLVDKSIDSVRVDVLAKGLNVTRGSFYWHFKDRDALLRQLLTTWRNTMTEQLIDRFEHSDANAETLLGELLSLPFRGHAAIRSASIELAIRAWARRNDMARQFVTEVDAKRLAYCAQCFVALGFSLHEANMRAFLLYSYVINESIMGEQGSEQQRNQRREFVRQLLLK